MIGWSAFRRGGLSDTGDSGLDDVLGYSCGDPQNSRGIGSKFATIAGVCLVLKEGRKVGSRGSDIVQALPYSSDAFYSVILVPIACSLDERQHPDIRAKVTAYSWDFRVGHSKL